jgi:uridine kinase
MDQGTRDELLDHLVAAVGSVAVAHPTRVAIDGAPASGKTTLADELATILREDGREVIRATIDGFLVPGLSAICEASTRLKAATSTPTTTTR